MQYITDGIQAYIYKGYTVNSMDNTELQTSCYGPGLLVGFGTLRVESFGFQLSLDTSTAIP